jgi:TfoX/Sxy family transcriptional regulator of competence genes
MAYDADLANRVREQFAEQDARTEVRMFGGLAFLVHGNMAVAVTHDDLMVRVGADAVEEALEQPHVRPLDMAGRQMRKWVLVAPPGVEDDTELGRWVAAGVRYAKSLPPKG